MTGQPGLFSYTPTDTALHRLDPRVKVIALIALQAVAFALTPAALLLLAAVTAAGYRAAEVSLLATLRRMLPLAVLLTVIVLLSAGENAGYAARIAVAVLVANLFTAVTRSAELTAVIAAALRPLAPRAAAQTALAASLTRRFIEVLFAETAEAGAAAAARGCNRPARRAAAVLGSILHRLPRRAEEISAALTARGYCGAPFTPPLGRPKRGDLFATAALAALILALLKIPL